MTNTSKAPAGLSFEFFPPSTPKAELRLWRTVERLAPLAPDYVSVTYGAGGTTRDRTNVAIRTIIERARLNVAGHLTCVGASREETLDVARSYARMGVRRIVALRGDAPGGASKFEPHPDGFASAAELVEGLSAIGDFDIAVAGYPEVHPEAESIEQETRYLKRKVEAGASRIITQFCFETDDFLRFRDRCEKAGIHVPIIPGILPVENFDKMRNFAKRCGAGVPDWMTKAFGYAKDAEQEHLLAVSIASEQCDRLVQEGVDSLHFYTLNNPDLTWDICRALGYEAAPLVAAGQAGAA